ncbi:MAG: hypothetical protein H6574_08990 [Lewinellaceae bacterium]|nr:hypothetical protein [Saprospiraceae bacterium]MCB9331202.1 hypothetical protein [Lewinellaceae bacterium]
MRTFTTCCLLVFALATGEAGWAQSARLPLEITLFDNATLLPGSATLGVVGIPVHPGISAGTEWRYNNNPKNTWYQTARAAYHYHRYVQHAIQLYSEFGYRRQIRHFDGGLRLGIGYLHAIPANKIFELNSQGQYARQRSIGRPQFMATSALALGYRIAGLPEAPVRIVLACQFYVQMPFSPGYVPLVPNTALHLGLSFPFFKH